MNLYKVDSGYTSESYELGVLSKQAQMSFDDGQLPIVSILTISKCSLSTTQSIPNNVSNHWCVYVIECIACVIAQTSHSTHSVHNIIRDVSS